MTNKTVETAVVDITETERLANYIRFQISQAEEILKPYVGSDKSSFKIYHIVNWRKQLIEELNTLTA